MKKRLFLIWLLCVALAYTALGAPPPSFTKIPNHLKIGMCDPFSKAAVAYLQSNGIPAVRITYAWAHFGGPSGAHAAVLFKWEGCVFFMDNCLKTPRVVTGKTDLGSVNQVYNYTFCRMENEQGDRIAPRKLSEIFAPAPAWLRELQVGPKR